MARKILVVDDSKLMHKVYEVMLRRYELVHAADGLEALEALTPEAAIDLVLLAIHMPRMNALEFLAERAARQDATRKVPVVIISTKGSEEDTAHSVKAGAAAYIWKPLYRMEVLDVIERLSGEAR